MRYQSWVAFFVITSFVHSLCAQVPQIINYQGRVSARGAQFDGPAEFKFSLVNSNGSVTFWSNDGSAVNGTEPTAAVSLVVDKGAFSVALGDTSLPNMVPIPPTVFTNSDVRLRVWFGSRRDDFQH